MAVEKIGAESTTYDVGDQYDDLSAANGVVASAGIDGDEMTGAFAAAFGDSADVPASLEDDIGTTATERSVDVDGGRLSATARWAKRRSGRHLIRSQRYTRSRVACVVVSRP